MVKRSTSRRPVDHNARARTIAKGAYAKCHAAGGEHSRCVGYALSRVKEVYPNARIEKPKSKLYPKIADGYM